jgi:hypothetical protein
VALLGERVRQVGDVARLQAAAARERARRERSVQALRGAQGGRGRVQAGGGNRWFRREAELLQGWRTAGFTERTQASHPNPEQTKNKETTAGGAHLVVDAAHGKGPRDLGNLVGLQLRGDLGL